MARITGKNAKILAVATRTTVSVAAAMTDSGDHLTYTFVVSAVTELYWNPNKPPAITRQIHGSGGFTAVAASAFTVDYVSGKVTFLVANNSDDVIKINGIEYSTVSVVGNMFDWTLDAKIGTTDATAFQDTFATKLSSVRSWNVTADGYHVSAYWWNLFLATNTECYIALYPDGAANERWVGAGHVSYAIDVKFDAAVKEKMKIEGTGAITQLTS